MKHTLYIQFFGSRGQSYETYQNSGGGGGSVLNSEDIDLPARMNKMFNGNKMSFEHTLDVFRDSHAFDKKQEHGILMDENGFVNFYVHGQAHSVFLTMRNEEIRGEKITKNKIAVHNHPSNSFYSKADLKNFSVSPISATVVVGRTQDYILRKSKNFSKNSKSFYNYVNRHSYNEIQKFLSNQDNQKKYGFSYTVRKH